MTFIDIETKKGSLLRIQSKQPQWQVATSYLMFLQQDITQASIKFSAFAHWLLF